MGLEWIVSKCLAKKAADRYQTATELLVDLRNVDLSSSGMSRISGVQVGITNAKAPVELKKITIAEGAKAAWPVIVVAFIVAIGLGYLLFSNGSQQSSPNQVERLPIYLDGITNVDNLALSPMSEYIAMTGIDTLGQRGLYLFNVGTAERTYIEQSDGGHWPLFSPDGSNLAFTMSGGVYIVTMLTGIPSLLVSQGRGTAWENSRSLLYFDPIRHGTFRIDIDSGAITPVALPDTSSGDPYNYWVSGVISETHLGIGNRERQSSVDPSFLVVDLDSGEMRFPEEGIINPKYVPGGFLVYQLRDNFGPFVLRPSDPKSGEFTGPPKSLFPGNNWSKQNVGPDGSYLYVQEMLEYDTDNVRLFLFDLADNSVEAIETECPRLGGPVFSPDSKFISFDVQSEGSPFSISTYDLKSKIFIARTFDDERRNPAWSGDGSSLYYDGRGSRSPGIYMQSLDTAGEEIPVLDGDVRFPALSPDGNWLAYSRMDSTDLDLLLYDLHSGAESVIDSSAKAQTAASFSPDSRYVAFQSNTSGAREVVVRPVSGTAYIPIGYRQARHPKWAPDGNSLYFLVRNDGIYRLPVTTDPSFQVLGEAEKVANIAGLGTGRNAFQDYDISPNGKVLVIAAADVRGDTKDDQMTYSTIMWWRNWAQSLKDE